MRTHYTTSVLKLPEMLFNFLINANWFNDQNKPKHMISSFTNHSSRNLKQKHVSVVTP